MTTLQMNIRPSPILRTLTKEILMAVIGFSHLRRLHHLLWEPPDLMLRRASCRMSDLYEGRELGCLLSLHIKVQQAGSL